MLHMCMRRPGKCIDASYKSFSRANDIILLPFLHFVAACVVADAAFTPSCHIALVCCSSPSCFKPFWNKMGGMIRIPLTSTLSKFRRVQN